MIINAISNTNFKAKMRNDGYYLPKIHDYLFENYRCGAEEWMDFNERLSKLPFGTVKIDDFVQHVGKDIVFGTVYPVCEHGKSFVAETYDSENLLSEIVDSVELSFKEKSNHPECPMCNP